MFSNPDLIINFNDSLPTLYQHDLMCTFYGKDACVISGKELKERKVEKITVAVFCMRECSYRLQAEMENELYFQS